MEEPDVDTPAEPRSETPLCTTCLRPVDPLDHYCASCGEAVGRFTGYIPYVDIPFLYNFWGRVWKRIWFEPQLGLARRAAYLGLLLVGAPIMLLGLPFVAWSKLRAAVERVRSDSSADRS